MPYLDIVSDILQRVASNGSTLPAHLFAAIESDVRKEWGGERHYIAKGGESSKEKISERDRMIRAAHAEGVGEDVLGIQYSLTVRRIRQILAVESLRRGDGLPIRSEPLTKNCRQYGSP